MEIFKRVNKITTNEREVEETNLIKNTLWDNKKTYPYNNITSTAGKLLVKTQIFPTSFDLAAVQEGYYLFSIRLFVQVVIFDVK